MAEEKFPMTVKGKRLLEEELKHLTTVERPTIVKAIEVARGHGDLSENADYSAAKERQGFIEGRIQEINGKLARALIGKAQGDEVIVHAPKGQIHYDVIKVYYE